MDDLSEPRGPPPGAEWTDSHPNLVFTAPYFAQVPLATILEPAVIEAAIEILPPLVQPAADQAAAEAVAELAVMKVGDTMSGPLFLSDLVPTQESQAASKHYVDAMGAADLSHALLDDLAGGGSIAAPGSNVRDYGAKGDGVTDDTAALTAAAATGLPLYFPPGTYLTGPLTVAQGLSGAGSTSIIKAKPGTATTSALITQNAVNGAAITDLALDGSNLVQRAIYCPATLPKQTGLRFENLEIHHVGTIPAQLIPLRADGILVEITTADATIKQAFIVAHCYVHDISGCGMSISGMGCVVSNNTVMNTASAGIDTVILVDGVIIGNTCYNVGTDPTPGIVADGITGYSRYNLRVLVTGNTVEKSGNTGIHFGGNHISINNNKIYDVYAHGVILQSDPNASPTPGATGVIANNTVYKTAAGAGVYVGYFSRVVVSGNTLTQIYMQGLQLFHADHCIAIGNVIDLTLNGFGIYTLQCDQGQIVNNLIYRAANKAFFDDTPASVNLRISDNIIDTEGVASAAIDRIIAAVGTGTVRINSPAAVTGAMSSTGLVTSTGNGFTATRTGAGAGGCVSSFEGTASVGAGFRVLGATGDMQFGPAGATSTLTAVKGTLDTAGGFKLAGGLGLFGGTPVAAKPTVSGAKGSNAALASLIAALVSYGLISDSTTA